MNPLRVVKLHGTNGSGKSYIATAIIDGGPRVEVGPAGAHLSPNGVYVIGRYTHPKTGQPIKIGGCDTVTLQADIIDAALSAMYLGPTLLEGIIPSTIFKTWVSVSHAIQRAQAKTHVPETGLIWAFLNTPLKLCLERVYTRNGGKPVKEDQIRQKWETIARMADKATEAGQLVYEIDYRNGTKQVSHLLLGSEL